MATLDQLRTAGERDLEKQLAKLDKRHRAAVKAAIDYYGRVQDIPEAFWLEMEFEIEQEQTAAIALLILAADEWTSGEIERQGVAAGEQDRRAAARSARDQARTTAGLTVDTLRKRLARRVEDARASGPGDVGELTSSGIDQALDDVFTGSRRAGIATDSTTIAFSTGQRAAATRAGRDGITNEAGQRVSLELIWRTERDNLVCARCSPLEGTPESVWGQVFPDGPGPAAHPNCRCDLQPQVIVEERVRESVKSDINPNLIRISDINPAKSELNPPIIVAPPEPTIEIIREPPDFTPAFVKRFVELEE